MNKNMFVSKMKLFGDTTETLAKAIGLSVGRLSAKLNSWQGAMFTQSEIGKIRERYDLAAYELEQIFFTDVVSCKDTSNAESEGE